MHVHVRYRLTIVLTAFAVALATSGCANPVASSTTDAGPIDGTVVESDDGLVYFLWDGGRQRIQQPRALAASDLATLDLTLGETAPPVLDVGDEGSFFAMYPEDGPESRLHLAVDGTLHPVDVVRVSADELAGVPDLEALVITRVRVP
jgi:hypothetical protein